MEIEEIMLIIEKYIKSQHKDDILMAARHIKARYKRLRGNDGN